MFVLSTVLVNWEDFVLAVGKHLVVYVGATVDGNRNGRGIVQQL